MFNLCETFVKQQVISEPIANITIFSCCSKRKKKSVRIYKKHHAKYVIVSLRVLSFYKTISKFLWKVTLKN